MFDSCLTFFMFVQIIDEENLSYSPDSNKDNFRFNYSPGQNTDLTVTRE